MSWATKKHWGDDYYYESFVCVRCDVAICVRAVQNLFPILNLKSLLNCECECMCECEQAMCCVS